VGWAFGWLAGMPNLGPVSAAEATEGMSMGLANKLPFESGYI
jgi:hypothetical protein